MATSSTVFLKLLIVNVRLRSRLLFLRQKVHRSSTVDIHIRLFNSANPSRWLPTVVVRVRGLVWSSGICGGQSGAEAGFLRVLRFPLPIFIPPIAPQSSSPIIWGWYNRPISGRRAEWTQMDSTPHYAN
jgi:hypothetical protein